MTGGRKDNRAKGDSRIEGLHHPLCTGDVRCRALLFPASPASGSDAEPSSSAGMSAARSQHSASSCHRRGQLGCGLETGTGSSVSLQSPG